MTKVTILKASATSSSSMTKDEMREKPKIGFKLEGIVNKKKTKNESFQRTASVLGSGDDDLDSRRNTASKRKEPLVIPLYRQNSKVEVEGVPASSKEDDDAIKALLKDTVQRSEKSIEDGVTNFSAKGSLVIDQVNTVDEVSSTISAREGEKNVGAMKKVPLLLRAKQRFLSSNCEGDMGVPGDDLQKDLSLRAKDVSSKSDIYEKVPISEFGAAMLRGMGWKGGGEGEGREKSPLPIQPRHHRLGLGALKKPGFDSKKLKNDRNRKRHWAEKPGSSALTRRKEEELEESQWKKKLEQSKSNNKQKTLQNGSIVYVCDSDGNIDSKRSRAIVTKSSGVPGLNRVAIRYEDVEEDVILKKSALLLVKQEEIDKIPFNDNLREGKRKKSISAKVPDQVHSMKDVKGKRSRSRSGERYRKRKREKQSKSHRQYDGGRGWLLPKIRVRIVSKKVDSGKHYKQKGIVMDVVRSGLAIIRMDSGEVLEVKEKDLETALPKPGGNVILLLGRNRLEKGKLVERQSEKGRGLVQFYDDMNIVKVSLDDIAEWCGPLDGDMDL